jgi:hypothetical protein
MVVLLVKSGCTHGFVAGYYIDVRLFARLVSNEQQVRRHANQGLGFSPML